ncbi:MAG: glycosyltransferase family 39 protein, partial [Planctomycetota bacterium]|nr:glycosyltransferase family 39 protein [Planctomycetota bacterium]
MFTRLWQTERPLLGLLALAIVLRLGVLWRYAPRLDEDRDLYRSIAEQLVAGNGYSRVYQWEMLIFNQPGVEPAKHLLLMPLEIAGPNELSPKTQQFGDPAWVAVNSPLFVIFFTDPELPRDLKTNSPFSLPTAYRPPLYPLLIAGTISLFHSHRALAGVHLVLGTLTVGLTVSAARRMKLDRGAMLAGLLVALDPLLLHHTPQVMTETLAAFLVTLLLWAASWRESRGKRVALGGVLG